MMAAVRLSRGVDNQVRPGFPLPCECTTGLPITESRNVRVKLLESRAARKIQSHSCIELQNQGVHASNGLRL